MFLTKVAWYQEIVSTGLSEGEFKVWEYDKADYEVSYHGKLSWLEWMWFVYSFWDKVSLCIETGLHLSKAEVRHVIHTI